MKKILFLTSSPRGELSHSKRVALQLVDNLRSAHSDVSITTRDLAAEPVPHIDGSFVAAAFTPESDRTDEQRTRLALSDQLVDELLWADVVVVASGMINFGVPSTLKAWTDHVARVGRTFGYSESGPMGLIGPKQVFIVSSSGGVYSSGPMAAFNHNGAYLRSVFTFLGADQIEEIVVEGVSMGPEALESTLNGALARAGELALV
ncbi:MAG: NAD(P)H-dependent oxidoreductase [Armatimonadetes bacterium]|nr:NAD(P)H-dependent oxidoreductase [Armatimonadota bacterium]MBS1727633.1 NAD(P)H-dependent oxidoreductase [Armatimonadota bacterium]